MHQPGRRSVVAGIALGLAGLPCAATARAAAADLRFRDGARTTDWLDFDLWGDRRIFLPALVNGRTGEVMLDSGVSGIVVDTAYARSVGLTTGATIPVHGLSQSTAGAMSVESVTLGIGSLILTAPRALLVDLSVLSNATGRALNLLVGRDLFQAAAVELDFEQRRFAAHAFRGFTPPSGSRALPLRRTGALRSIAVSMEGRRPVQAIFDLGNGGALDVSARHLETEGLLGSRRTSTTATLGVEGRRIDRTLTLSSVRLGDWTLPDVPTLAATEWSNDARGIDAPAYLGIDILSRFRIATDYARNRIWLSPGARADIPFRRDRAGLRLLPLPRRYEVFHVCAGGPAERTGFREGEQIVAVDGQVVPASTAGLPRHWNEGEAGRIVGVTMADGSRRNLMLENYY